MVTSSPPPSPSANAPTPGNGELPAVRVLTAHPQMEQSRVNRRLMQAAQRASRQDATGRLGVTDLYARYPDYLIDVPAEQAQLTAAQLIVWQHPIHWYSMPALMKLWVDEVLAYGWAYGPGGTALRGKDLWLVATTGGPEDSYHPQSYNRYFFDAFLPPYEQTAALCGMRFLPPLLLHGAHRADEANLLAHTELFAQRLASYPNWPEIESLPYGFGPGVPADARPEESELVSQAPRAQGRP